MLDSLLAQALHQPTLYERTPGLFWGDPYVSTQLLKAHLDEENPLASRSPEFITRSVEWIASWLPVDGDTRILDLGCGPGMYASRFSRLGYSVTGFDVSPASIAYAREESKRNGSAIDYVERDYLEGDLGGSYDMALLAYCDYGALSAEERSMLLGNVLGALRPGGLMILDVFSEMRYRSACNSSQWEMVTDGGLWEPEAYLCLEKQTLYPPNVILDRYIVLSSERVKSYNVWTTCFDAESLRKEAEGAGFEALHFADDLCGAPFTGRDETIAVVLRRTSS